MRDIEAAGIKHISVPEDYLMGRVLARNIVDADTGEIIANANDELTEELLGKLRDANVQRHPDPVHQRPRPGRATSRRPCASTTPPTRSPRAWRSTA